mgnify:CR=1 FL=1
MILNQWRILIKKVNKIVDEDPILKDKVSIDTLSGPFFFGAMSVFDQRINEQMNLKKSITILRMQYVPFIDTTGIERLRMFIVDRKKKGYIVVLSKLKPEVEAKLRADIEFVELLKDVPLATSTLNAIEISRKILEEQSKKENKPTN